MMPSLPAMAPRKRFPGPLFTFAAYLGAVVRPSPHGLAGAALGLIGIFLPGVLILMGTLPFWETFRKRAGAQAVMRGVNAAVVGLLGAALYNPVWTSSVKTPGDFAIRARRLCPPHRLARAAARRRRHQRARRDRPCASHVMTGETSDGQAQRSNDTLPGFRGIRFFSPSPACSPISRRRCSTRSCRSF